MEEGIRQAGRGRGRKLTGKTSHALGSVPCACRVPQPVRAYSVKRKVRLDSTIIVI